MPVRSGASGKAEPRRRQPNEVREGSKPPKGKWVETSEALAKRRLHSREPGAAQPRDVPLMLMQNVACLSKHAPKRRANMLKNIVHHGVSITSSNQQKVRILSLSTGFNLCHFL